MNRRQQEVITYVQAENEVLKEQLDTKVKKLKLNNSQRRKLAKQGETTWSKALEGVGQLSVDVSILCVYRSWELCTFGIAVG